MSYYEECRKLIGQKCIIKGSNTGNGVFFGHIVMVEDVKKKTAPWGESIEAHTIPMNLETWPTTAYMENGVEKFEIGSVDGSRTRWHLVPVDNEWDEKENK